MRNSFVEKLNDLLQESGKQQVEICKDLKIPKVKLTRWKKGYTEPNMDELLMLSVYFNVSLDYLLGKTDI